MGKSKQQRKAALVEEGVQAFADAAVEASVRNCPGPVPPPPPPLPGLAVGDELLVLADYLDMEGVGEENGLPHAGYLVLLRSEVVRILYLGSADTGDPGWLYGEVLRSLHKSEPPGRRGWLPAKAVQAPRLDSPPAAPLPARAASGKAPGAQPNRLAVAGGSPAQTAPGAGPTGPGRPVPKPPDPPLGREAPPAAQRATVASAVAGPCPGSRHGPRGGALAGPSDEAFPALRAERPGPPSSTGRDRKYWGPDAPGLQLAEALEPSVPASPEERAKLIERQRAAAAAAAAKTKGLLDGHQVRCPICTDVYTSSGVRRRMRRPCCNSELCANCDHKSLRSGKCYFCREASDEFPLLGLACRVAS